MGKAMPHPSLLSPTSFTHILYHLEQTSQGAWETPLSGSVGSFTPQGPAAKTVALVATTRRALLVSPPHPGALTHHIMGTLTPSLPVTSIFGSEVTGAVWPQLPFGSNHFQAKERKDPS